MGPAPEDIAEAIIRNMADRHGFRQQWDQCDADTRTEIRETWTEIIRKIMFPE